MVKRASLARLVPPGVLVSEVFNGEPIEPLHPSESAWLAGTSLRRHRQFAAGRHCVRACLRQLGLDVDDPLLPDIDNVPEWPDGIIGAVTHVDDYTAAVIGAADRIDGIGIAAERNRPLPPALLALLANQTEQNLVEAQRIEHPEIAWGRVMVCAKKAVHKAKHPIDNGTVDPAGARVELRSNGSFIASTIDTSDGVETPQVVPGRFAVDADRIVAVAAIGLGRRR